jgi:uncharacterized protein YijF (DUF1287 family)
MGDGLQSASYPLESGHPMRSALVSLLVLCASSAYAQNIFQMNAAVQNQYNMAQQSVALPYYYRPVYRPLYAPRRFDYYGGDFYRTQAIFEQQRQTRALRSIDNTLQNMELDLPFSR